MRVRCVVLAGCSVLLGGCSEQPPPGPGAAPEAAVAASAGGRLRVPHRVPTDLNPFTTQDQVTRRAILRFTHEALLELDPASGDLRPALAERYELLDEGQRARFFLRAGAGFSDGTRVTSDDLVFTFEAATAPEAARGALASVLRRAADVRAVDARTVDVTLREPGPEAFGAVATGFLVLQRAHFTAAGLGAQDPGPGSGPYMLPRAADGSAAFRRPLGFDAPLQLVRNPHGWQRAARPGSWWLDRIELRFFANDEAQQVALRRGEIDWLVVPDPDALLASDPRLAAGYRPLVYDPPSAGCVMVVWNHRRPALADARVRRALTQLFDREALAREFWAGHARVPESWADASGYATRAAAPPAPWPHDPAVARGLLREAAAALGGGRPRVELLVASNAPQHRQLADYSAAGFAAAGVQLDVQAAPWNAVFARLSQRDFDGLVLYASGDPWRSPRTWFHSEAAADRNWMGYADAGMDAALDRLRAAREPGARAAAMAEVEELLHRDQPVTVLLRPRVSLLLHRRFRAVEVGPAGLSPERWWVPAAERR